jgi:GH18 family chitinase
MAGIWGLGDFLSRVFRILAFVGRWKNDRHLTTSLVLFVLLVACGMEQQVIERTEIGQSDATEPSFRVIAYVTAAVVPEAIPYADLTHINYAFLIPNDDGTFAHFPNAWKLETIVAQAQEAGVKVLISVGGWGWHEQFEALAAGPETRSRFVQNLATFVAQYGLDGADIDWEYPRPGESADNFLQLIRELRQAMPDRLLTTAVVAYGDTGAGVLSDTFELFDFVNIMTYDGPDHGTMAQFEAGLDYWQGRGLPPAKTVMGVPFYARPNEMTYRRIVAVDPEAAYVDALEYHGSTIHYNGIPTIQAKTRLARERAGGIMFWTLEHDAPGDMSLLKAITGVVKE